MNSESSTPTFHVCDSPIDHGLTLLEASAGTGKTYSLVRIVARHLVENDLTIDQILTVTFTVAATAEIKGRLHELLSEISRDLKLAITRVTEQDTSSFPEGFNDLVKGWYKKAIASPDATSFLTNARLKISSALAHFDSVPIFTIDGFFNRLLKEHAFEANRLFSVDFETQDDKLVAQALRDYWRQHVYSLDANDLAEFQSHVNFEKAIKFLTEALRAPNAIMAPEYATTPPSQHSVYQKAWDPFISLLKSTRDELEAFVRSPVPGLKKNKAPYNSRSTDKFFALVDSFLKTPKRMRTDIATFDALSWMHLSDEAAFNKGKYTDLSSHPLIDFFHSVDHLKDNLPSNLQSSYYGEILQFVKTRIQDLKKERNVQSHSDVTHILSSLLAEDSLASHSVQQSTQSKYFAALIDEFQDTSPEQCDVFLKLFHHTHLYFHIIGDPKQSIYRFRGADVFSYIQASRAADHRFQLLTNFRSTPRMIHAVNQLFLRHSDPFLVNEQITFSPSKWQDQADSDDPESTITPPDGKPTLFLHPISNDIGNAEDVKYACFRHITSEISHLLGKKWSDYDPENTTVITPSDIAVLTRSKAEAESISRLLGALNIPVTVNTKTSLIESQESEQLFTILAAFIDPRKSEILRTALLTPQLGGGQFLTSKYDAEFDSITHQAVAFNKQWHRDGLMPMMLRFVASFEVRTRLLAMPQGQRRLTNFMHLVELLDDTARKNKLTPEATLQWFEMALQDCDVDSDVESEALELRIATDDAAVQIRTQHTSKGLEFPIVFSTCPCFAEVDTGKRRPDLTYHNHQNETFFDAVDNTDKSSDAYQIRKRESLADASRLAYVAVTRAKYLCHFYIVPVKETKTTYKVDEHAIYQMLGTPSSEDLDTLAADSSGTIVHAPLDTDSPQLPPTPWSKQEASTSSSPPALTSRDANNATITHHTRVTSFSGITHTSGNEFHFTPPTPKQQNSQNTPTPKSPNSESPHWATFQAGASLGSAFHEILEEVDFQDLSTAAPVIENKLVKHSPWRGKRSDIHFPEAITQIESYLTTLVNHPLDTPDASSGISSSLKLCDIPLAKRLTEPAFLLSGKGFSLASLAHIIANDPPPFLPDGYIDHLSSVPHLTTDGFLNGFIDLVFEHNGRYHLLDWKTNRLDDYSQESIALSMADHHYFLQYHLYTLALDRFLASRLTNYDPTQHLGNTYYVYLRGINPSIPGSGVFTDAMSPDRLNALRNLY